MSGIEFSQRRVDASLRVSEVGAIAVPVLFTGSAWHVPYAMLVVANLVLIASLIFLYRNRLQDEFLHKHWNAGASAGFFAICLWSVLAPFLTGLWDGMYGQPKGTSPTDEILAVGVMPVAMGAFFIAFQLNRWRNR